MKFSRKLPQTPWILNNERLHSNTSLEEIVATPFIERSGAEKGILTSSGREDVDVRTLGNGRPFLIELVKVSFFIKKISLIPGDQIKIQISNIEFDRYNLSRGRFYLKTS